MSVAELSRLLFGLFINIRSNVASLFKKSSALYPFEYFITVYRAMRVEHSCLSHEAMILIKASVTKA